ncbi:protein-glutamate O-methyltransferase CheR [Paenibacillus sp. N1-5-1-14]|uniref:CheR family methyltransferase n=1 Tax=Paenibacillus radicibacter TaxID=2972488 RepID=UPI0021598AED|nr:protein-glutamate O-methyltransferase CheR [Paenibacillus radicibacter]MCR8642289.1 protein-glutamate O-methyltransferase CheR [Paenibacillus radicibacter]
MDDKDYTLFIEGVKSFTGIDLAQYKEAQMKRRLTTLRTKKGYASFALYLEALKKDKLLLNEFLDRMTINVSEFWRNPNRWEILEKRFLPEMLANNRRLKVWSAACSTGEEPYTLAMILAEQGALKDSKLIATDIDDNVLEKARVGQYIDRAVRDVPPAYLKKYMIEQGVHYTASEELKRGVTFKKQNLLLDTFETGFDLIVCRNVIIYFTDEAKTELFHKFARALRPGGILFVGSTEQIFSPGVYGFEPAETFFYRKK